MHKSPLPCGGTHPPPQPPLLPFNDIVSFPIPFLQQHRYNRHHHDDTHHRHRLDTSISPPFMVTTTVASAASSWLRNRRIRYLLLLLCSPVILILLCAALPFLCAAELCLRRCLWRNIAGDPDDGGDRLRRCEEGCCWDYDVEEKGLLHRYLEDQLLLVGSMYDCGDDDDDEEEQQEPEDDSRRVEDVSKVLLLR